MVDYELPRGKLRSAIDNKLSSGPHENPQDFILSTGTSGSFSNTVSTDEFMPSLQSLKPEDCLSSSSSLILSKDPKVGVSFVLVISTLKKFQTRLLLILSHILKYIQYFLPENSSATVRRQQFQAFHQMDMRRHHRFPEAEETLLFYL